MNSSCCISNIAPHYRKSIYELMDRELKCDFYLGDEIESPIKLMKYNGLVNFKKMLRNKKVLGNFYWQQGAIKTIFKPYKTYILTGEPYCLSTWFILLSTKLIKSKRTILWSHGFYGDEGTLKKIIKKLFFGLSDNILLYGNYSKALMIKEGISSKKIEVIYNSLNYEKQLRIRNKLNFTNIFSIHFGNNHPVLIFTGRLTSSKKLDFLINAHLILSNQGLHFNVVMVGSGPAHNELELLIKNLNLSENYWFYGPCYDENKIGELFFNSIVCVSPGNVGLTAIHSLTYGTPVISHNNWVNQMPEFEAITEGETGFFFEENDEEDLSRAIKKAYSVNRNRDLKNKCFEVIDNYYNPNFQLSVLKKINTSLV